MKYALNLILSFVLLALFVTSCSDIPKSVKNSLSSADYNVNEFQKIIDHYKSTGENEKLHAAYYLIVNMAGHYSLDGDVVKNYDVIFDIIDSIHRKKIKIPIESPVVQGKWDSLMNIYGKPMVFEADSLPDTKKMKAKYLIDHIDYCYLAWKTQLLSEKLSVKDFYKFILPYRNGSERLDGSRKYLFEKYRSFRDTVKANNRIEYASKLNKYLKTEVAINHTFKAYPFDMSIAQFEKGKRGGCKQLVFYTASVMRANGLAVGTEYGRWGDRNGGHEWNVLLRENGSFFPFEAAASEFGGISKFPYRLCKVFRDTFVPSDIKNPSTEDIPEVLINPYKKDITYAYTKTYDINVPLPVSFKKKKKYAIITTYGANNWVAQDWGIIKKGAAYFKNMGSNLLYLVMYFDNGTYYPASNPFILTKEGKIKYVIASTKDQQKIILTRKYPYFPKNNVNARELVGGRIQGANRLDFSDSVTFAIVKETPVNFKYLQLPEGSRYRFIRFLSAKGKKSNLAEFEVYGLKNKRLKGDAIAFPKTAPELGNSYENAFDGDPDTFYLGDKDSLTWVGIDLGVKTLIKEARYCPRSDTNFIIVGDTYELLFWDGKGWIKMGKKIAKEQSLSFTSVPVNGIYVLKNLYRGQESRVFTYENDKQVWW